MNYLDYLRAALQVLRVSPLRSTLTILGVIIGVAAMIAMVSVGAGAQAHLAGRIQSLGSNLIVILSGSITSGGARLKSTELTITEDDALAIQNEIASVQAVAPLVRGSAQVVAGNLNWSTFIEGVLLNFFDVREWEVARGDLFTPDDDKRAAKVAIVGETVVDKLFPGEEPLGQLLRIGRVPFTVIGVLAQKGQNPQGQDQDDIVIVPLATAQQRLLGGERIKTGAVTTILVKVRQAELLQAAEQDIRNLLRQRHRLRPDQPDDFSLRNLTEILDAQQEAERALTLLLAAVASVSLLVGGIGIMNIMLVSVTERTHEIGLRMAVGANDRDIRTQFLVEAVTLSLIGGVIGIVLGVSSAFAINHFASWPILIQPTDIGMAFGFASAIGIIFGYYPAHKAARLDPLEALRHE
jgi:putative ABC transport system permease protein